MNGTDTRPVEPFHVRSARQSLAACQPGGEHADKSAWFQVRYLSSALGALLARVEEGQ